MTEKQEGSVESEYLKGYLRGTLDATKANDVPSHLEVCDCAAFNLSEWLWTNGTYNFNRRSGK